MIYESALGRLAGEVAAAEGTDADAATETLLKLLRAQYATPEKTEEDAAAAA